MSAWQASNLALKFSKSSRHPNRRLTEPLKLACCVDARDEYESDVAELRNYIKLKNALGTEGIFFRRIGSPR